MILSFRLFQSDIVTHPKAGAYKRRAGRIHSEEWAYSDATGVCHFWHLSAWAGLTNSLTVSILPSQQRSNRRLRPEPTGSMIGVGYTLARCNAGGFQKSGLPTSLLKPFLSTGYGLLKMWLGMICKPLSRDTREGLSLRSAASRSKLVP